MYFLYEIKQLFKNVLILKITAIFSGKFQKKLFDNSNFYKKIIHLLYYWQFNIAIGKPLYL